MDECRLSPIIVDKPLPINVQVDLFKASKPTLPKLDFDIPYIDMSQFGARYTCGGTSLKEGREVSRKRMSICLAGIDNGDVLAQSVAKRIESYNIALRLCQEHEMSVELLCDLHTLLTPEDETRGNLRQHQNWVGAMNIEQASVVPPSPDLIHGLLKDWVHFVEHTDIAEAENALLAFSYFIVAHPFSDGNGRLSRLLLTSFLLGNNDSAAFLSPTLFRLNHFEESRGELFATPRAVLGGEWNHVKSYWKRAFQWQQNTSEKITKQVTTIRRVLENALILIPRPDLASELSQVILNQPLLTLELVCKKLRIDPITADNLLEALCRGGLLKRLKLKQPNNTIVFSCEMVFKLWADIDSLLFEPTSREQLASSSNLSV